MKKSIKKIQDLRKQLLEYSHKYYNLNYSEISDYLFDQKLKELISLEKQYPELYDPNSPSKKIGLEVEKDHIKNHNYKMYSLQNAYSKEDLINWNKKINKSLSNFSFICELKYDGISINLVYKKGIFIHALTRGNGLIGENVTDNVIKYIKPSIPLKLNGNNFPNYLEIRGEIFITRKNFININKLRLKNGKNSYSNFRHAASGIIRSKNIKIKKKFNLSFIAFHALGQEFYTQYDALNKIQHWGFEVSNIIRVCYNLKDVFNFINYWKLLRHTLYYQIDGIVIKINEYKKQLSVGYTIKYPKWAIAYKFKQNVFETKLINIKFQVGRTGIITPVAHVNPISISGTIIKKVAIYNNNFIQKNDLHYGDIIFLEKSGDIIPIIKNINKSKRSNNTYPVLFLRKCPSCNHSLQKIKNIFYCINKDCSYIKIMKLIHFVSENAMNIKGIGKITIKKLYEKRIIYDIHHFFKLKKNDLMKINGIKDKLADYILININKSKKNSYQRVLYSLGIRYVGENVSKILSEYFYNIKLLINADYNYLISIPGIGVKIAKSIIDYFYDYKNIYVIKMLIQHGLILSKKKIKNNHYITGKNFVFTGKLYCMTRIKAKTIIESLGGKVYTNISNKIDFLVVGKNFGSKFRKSIEKKNIKILTESCFKKIIKNINE
ncbi:NAD-dependent DNA ligase LigA [Blattabacterium cuenoti]|uniref:NAD-dependent DNA ligase LigA n=1 Tax=Blattabacterium cuenoti TaxID=1653831 RepID=UPI00163BCA1C|nr:NAD-dependent DNA ligase LigA [Blattabacterium cuenoti]